MKSITAKEFKKLIEQKDSQNIQIVDVRSKGEWEDGHIKDERVINIEVNSLMFDTSKLDKEKEIYLICESGGRSSFAQMILGTKGFSCTDVEGGMSSFRKL